MALLPPIPGSVLTQGFGPSRLLAEPAMYASATLAYWQPYTGLRFHQHFHAAQDLAAPLGTPILASEAGVVEYAGIGYIPGTRTPNGGGLVIKVRIRPDVWYEHSHCSSLILPTGRTVKRGEIIARVGNTGTVTGIHDHFTVLMRQVDRYNVARTFIYDPRQFLPGGSRADDPRIKPLVIPGQRVRLNGPGINIRTTPDLDIGSTNVYATSTSSGILRYGVKIAELDAALSLHKTAPLVINDDGSWYRLWLNGGFRYVKKELCHVV